MIFNKWLSALQQRSIVKWNAIQIRAIIAKVSNPTVHDKPKTFLNEAITLYM